MQYHNIFHPIDKSNTELRKIIMTMRDPDSMWEDIAGHRDEEVKWEELTPM